MELFSRTDENPVPDLVADCRLMLRYARRNAFALSPDLISKIAALDAILKQQSLQSISDIDSALVAVADPAVANSTPPPDVLLAPQAVPGAVKTPLQGNAEEMILAVHDELSKVIAPTTALTLQASEPPPGKHRFFGGMPLVVRAAAFAALASAVLFVTSAGVIAQRAAEAKKEAAEKQEKGEQAKRRVTEGQPAGGETRQTPSGQGAPSAPSGGEKGGKS